MRRPADLRGFRHGPTCAPGLSDLLQPRLPSVLPSAGLFAVVIVPAWLLILAGRLDLSGPFVPVDWHIHEMLFGYGSAVLAGFLFTAVPNWTGRRPIRELPLALLLGLWVLGRLAVAEGFRSGRSPCC